MRILFVHQNFPGQFVHLAPALARRGHEVLALTVNSNQRPSPVNVARYAPDIGALDIATFRLSKTYAEMTRRGEAAAMAAVELQRRHGFEPDVVFGNIGWGETLFLRDVWPRARHIAYAEFFYRAVGLDADFDPEFRRDVLGEKLWIESRKAHLFLAMDAADAAVAPTRWQASTFPSCFHPRIRVIHDGIDTRRVRPDASATVQLPGIPRALSRGDEILTFVNRNLEPYRGYHIFMRALPRILAERPKAQAVIVGGDGASYGPKPESGTWKHRFLDEVKDRLDLSRVHFTGQIPYGTFVDLMKVTRVHAYLTVPFVLSWSMLEGMAAGALVVGSSTPPVGEVITDGVNGRLVDFFDVDAWASTLIEALARPAAYDDMREAARQTILDRYDLTTQCLPKQIEFVEGM